MIPSPSNGLSKILFKDEMMRICFSAWVMKRDMGAALVPPYSLLDDLSK